MLNKKHTNITKGKKRDLESAQKNLQRMLEEIKPFIKKRVLKSQSTAGRWCITSNLYS